MAPNLPTSAGVGIPYAFAEVDAAGYFVRCPVALCGQKFYDDGQVREPEPEDQATKGAVHAYAVHYQAEHAGPRDHTQCPPDAHDFDPGDVGCEERVDEHGRLICNGCPALVFYCRLDEDWHHAGDAEPCFLIPGESFDVAVPGPTPIERSADEIGRLRDQVLDLGEAVATLTRQAAENAERLELADAIIRWKLGVPLARARADEDLYEPAVAYGDPVSIKAQTRRRRLEASGLIVLPGGAW